MQAQILHAIDSLAVLYMNSNRKKGAPKIKPSELMQPDYVEKAKKEAKKRKREDAKIMQTDLAEIFEKRNSQIIDKEVKCTK